MLIFTSPITGESASRFQEGLGQLIKEKHKIATEKHYLESGRMLKKDEIVKYKKVTKEFARQHITAIKELRQIP